MHRITLQDAINIANDSQRIAGFLQFHWFISLSLVIDITWLAFVTVPFQHRGALDKLPTFTKLDKQT